MTIVTAVYYSNPLSVMGGRGWNFSYYKPALYAISQLGAKRVIVYHDKHQQPELESFIKEYGLTTFELQHKELDELLNYERVHALKEKQLVAYANNIEHLYENNNKLHLLYLAKPWFLQNAIKVHEITNSPLIWIDAGFFQHSIFPESLGGVELARFNFNNYYPANSSSKINYELGNRLYKLLTSDNKIFGYGNQTIISNVEWGSEIATTELFANLVSGFFGGMPDALYKLHNEFYKLVDLLLNAGIIPSDSTVISAVHAKYPDLFSINTFDTWHHDIPTDPCYFLKPGEKVRSFYKSFFNLIESNEILLNTSRRFNLESSGVKQSQIIKYEQYDLPNIALYGSHNASVAVEYKGKILEVVELERLLNVKNAGYAQYYVAGSRKYIAKLVTDYFKEKYGFTEYGYCLHQHSETLEEEGRVMYWKQFPAKHYIECKHHEAHAAGTFYQSPYQEAIILSIDGGGNDGFFNIYKAKRGSPLQLIKQYQIDLGFAYMIFGEYLGDIKKEPALNLGNLVYAGKILGLQSYGKVRSEWIEAFKHIYLVGMDGLNYQKHFAELSEQISVNFDINNRLTGQVAYDVAATSQYVFEEIIFSCVNDIILNNPNLPICVTGGCALNIVLNTKLKEKYNRQVFVAPNSNDCGLAVGMLANMMMPNDQIDITYAGLSLIDKQRLPEYVEKYSATFISLDKLANSLMQGEIVGFVQGNSEHGPRALGHRSILCNPLLENMKDTLNKKVKNREWYRPFAPVVRLEDVSEYFEWNEESRWMNFCPKVRPMYRTIIPAIVHVDNTARVQTVTREQNPVLYDLITEFKKLTGIGVLLNTSFNVDGKPILSTLNDAFKVFETTQLGALYIEGFYFNRKMGPNI